MAERRRRGFWAETERKRRGRPTIELVFSMLRGGATSAVGSGQGWRGWSHRGSRGEGGGARRRGGGARSARSPTDADIPSIHTIQPMNQKQDTSSNMNHGPLIRSHAKKLQQSVTSLLAEFDNNITENVILSKSSTLVIIMFK
jgi:hypothetical protein